MTVLEQLGALVTRYEAPSQDTVHAKLRLHVADTIAAWVASSATVEGKALLAFRARMQGGASEAALLNDVAAFCAVVRLSEIDDIHLPSMTTAGSIVIPGALAIAASLPKVDAADLAAAILAGYEVMIRFGRAIDGPSVLYRGIWPTYFAAPLGVAAVAARLMNFDEETCAHALALALTTAAPGVGHHGAVTTSRWFAVGNAARNGLTAALAARDGFTSDLKLLDGPFLQNAFNIALRTEALTADGGEPAIMQVSFKPWCAARQTMAATQALREVIASGVATADIVSIEASVLPPHLKMIDHGVVAGDRASYLTSLPYQMAVAALDPSAARDIAQSPGELSPAMRAFMGLTKVAPDDSLLEGYPAAWPARLRVTTKSATHEHAVSHVPGDPASSFDEAAISAKFESYVKPVLGAATANLLARSLAVLESGDAAGLLRDILR